MSSKFADANPASSTRLLLVCWNQEASAIGSRRAEERNAEVAEEISLKKGSMRRKFRLRPIPDAEKPPILKAYLDNAAGSVG